jgi:ATP-dependent Lon protease
MPRIKQRKDKKEPSKRRSRPDHDSDSDSSVDERGNIRGLVAYSSDEDDKLTTSESSWHESSSSEDRHKNRGKKSKRRESESASESESEESHPPKRRAAKKAEKKIKRRIAAEEAAAAARRRRRREREREEEEAAAAAASVRSRRRRRDRKREEEEESDDEEMEDDEEENEEEKDEDEDEDEDEDDEEEYEEEERPRSGIELVISDLAEALQPPKPKKYKLSKEPANVRRFVKLVQSEVDPAEEDIDRDIGYFKALTPKAQDRLLSKLQNKVEPVEPTVPLKFQILMKDVPAEVERVALGKHSALQHIDQSSTEYYKTHQWIHGYTQLPIGTYIDLPVKIETNDLKENAECKAFVTSVHDHMNAAIYGHEEAKLQILQFVSNWIINPRKTGNVLSIHGPPGVGKTTLIAEGVAKALGRPFHFITLGGATDASYLDGHSYTYEGSTWGRIVDVLIKSKCMNPVIYFDELDKVSETPKGEEINNMLIHLTDSSQNNRFQDKYFAGIDLDLSRCLFIFSHNDHSRINPILKDRMYNIQVDGFDLKQKLVISEQYLVNAALRDAKLFEKIGFNRELLTYIIEKFTGEEKGVRELKRCIETIVSKVNLLRFYNDPAKVDFAIAGFSLPFTLKKEHIELFLKKKERKDDDMSRLAMYT